MKLKLIVILIILSILSFSYEVREVRIPSNVMNTSPKATVILPKNYGKTSKRHSVVYILHGWMNDYNSVVYHTEIGKLSDLYSFIIVMPDGGINKWYYDSPENSDYRYGTYVGKEVPEYIDKNYKTIKKRSARAITGYSMGGFGAFNAVINYPETFGSVGSMSGAVDIRSFNKKWNLEKIFGKYNENTRLWDDVTIYNNLNKVSEKKLNIIISCGSEDFFIDINRELHEKMKEYDLKHTYIESPGGHNWDYWRKEIKFQMLYFSKYL